MRFVDPDYDYSQDEIDDLRLEARAVRRHNNALARHPQLQDPDWPGELDADGDCDGDADPGDAGADAGSGGDDTPSPLDPCQLNLEWDADAC